MNRVVELSGACVPAIRRSPCDVSKVTVLQDIPYAGQIDGVGVASSRAVQLGVQEPRGHDSPLRAAGQFGDERLGLSFIHEELHRR